MFSSGVSSVSSSVSPSSVALTAAWVLKYVGSLPSFFFSSLIAEALLWDVGAPESEKVLQKIFSSSFSFLMSAQSLLDVRA